MLTSERLLIRPVQPDELPSILAVYRECEDFLSLGPVATASIEMVQADLRLSQNEGGVFCGIYDQTSQQMIGVVDFVRSGWEGFSDRAYLSLLMISAPYRSRGIGAEVVRIVEEELMRGQAIKAIAAGVQVNNPGAIRFWQRMGYAIVSEPRAMDDGTVAYNLLKQVEGQG